MGLKIVKSHTGQIRPYPFTAVYKQLGVNEALNFVAQTSNGSAISVLRNRLGIDAASARASDALSFHPWNFTWRHAGS
jgi:hypothetical protein